MSDEFQVQGSDAWLEFRKSRVCSSDLPAILGVSKWATAYQLWQRKLGFIEEQKNNWAMSRGTRLEPVVRDLVNECVGYNFEPDVLEHPDLPWCAASLDGIDRDNDCILEIKCPGLEDHHSAANDEIPVHYYPQVQWAMFVSETSQCIYASFYDEELHLLRKPRDDDYIRETLLPAAKDFYEHLSSMTEPPKSERDVVQITDPQFEAYAREWKAAYESRKLFEQKERYYRNKLISLTDDSDCEGYGVRCKRVSREGNMNWAALYEQLLETFPEIADIDLSRFRSEQIGYWKISQI